MRKTCVSGRIIMPVAVFLVLLLDAFAATCQAPAFYRRLPIGDFAVYAEGIHGGLSDSSNHGVLLRKKVIVNGGNIGSSFFVDIKDSGIYYGHMFSGERILVGNGNTFSGNFHINNEASVSWPVLKAGQFNKFGVTVPTPNGGLITSRGHIQIAFNSTVNGPVFITPGYNYQGPPPANGVHPDTSAAPVMPLLPYVTPFPPYDSSNDIINTSISISPGAYGDLVLDGSTLRTITLTTPGTYVFRSINLIGKNIFNFNFPPGSKGYRIYVHGDVNLGQITTHTDGNYVFNNPLAARIFMEVHGGVTVANGGYAFRIVDAPAPNESNWLGTVYAPFAGIQVGNNHPTYIDGALWSKKRVELGNNVSIRLYKLITPRNEIDPYYPAPTGGKVDNTQPRIGAELYSLINYRTTIDTISTNTIFQLDSTTERVSVEVVAQDGQYNTVYNYLVSKGLINIIPNNTGSLVITGDFPIDSLSLLNSRTDIFFVRPLLIPLNNAGIVTSQGDARLKTDVVRSAYHLTGNGVKVGVISDSYNNKGQADEDIESEDLPGDVQIVKEYPGTTGTDEGRAMMQIIYDVAPAAKLAFRTGTVTATDFASGIRELAASTLNGGACNIIVDDVTWPTEPFFRDGTVARAVNEVKAQGVTYFSAAGNFGSRSYEAVFSSSGTTPSGLTGPAHAFGTEIYQTLSLKAGNYTIVLQWDDDVYSLGGNLGAQTDLDIYLLEFGGTTLFGFNRDNIGGDPIEILPFIVNEDTEAKLAIVKASGSADPRFKFIIFRGDGTILNGSDASSTLVGQANCEGAIAVGAMLYDNISPYVTTPNTVASFSSRGGTPVKENGQFITRQKPEIVAPNGVNTKVTLGGTDIESDGLPNFFGTSAAAPHAAGVAALLIEGKKTFNLQSAVTPDEIKALLISSAEDLHDSGYDVYSGYGLINAENAIRLMANPTPSITSIRVTDSTDLTVESDIPGISSPFVMLVKGDNLEPSTQVFFGGEALVSHYVDENRIWAVVDSFSGNPSVKLYTGPKSISQADAGFSDSMNLYDNKRIISITIDNASRKYGASNPSFTATITVDGVPIDSTNFTQAQLGLNKVIYSTTAHTYSSVYTYPIEAYLDLDPVLDSQVIAENVYQFTNGILSVNRLPVKVTPENKVMTYGDDPGVISYHYEFDQTGMADPSGLLDSIKALHKTYRADNVLAVINDFHQPLSNNYVLSAADLANMSTMASFQSIKNARRFKVVDDKLTTLTDSVADSEFGLQRMIVDVGAQSIYNYTVTPSSVNLVESYPGENYRSLVNAKQLANGTAYVNVNGQLMAMVNGQLMAMVNENLLSLVNGQLMAMVNGQMEIVEGLSMVNGQLMAMVNGQLMAMVNGQLMAMVNGVTINVDINTDIVEINGQLMAMVNGQLMAMVNGQLMAMVNGQLMAMVNGQLMAMVNGQLMAMVNGQLMAMVNGELTLADNLSIQNGQLMAMVNGQLMAMVNGQLMAMVNGQLMAMVNGQLMAMVNNEVEFVEEVSMVNGQLMAMVNGQLMAMVNGQLMAMVNGEVVTMDNISVVNGQLMAMVNGQLMAMVNGQLMAMVNGQLMAMVNGSGLGSSSSNTNTTVIIDSDDIDVQGNAIGGMASVNMITGLDAGIQKLVPATFSHDNFEVTYGLGEVIINPAQLVVTAQDTARNYGEPNPQFVLEIDGYVNGDDSTSIIIPQVETIATQSSATGAYPLIVSGGNATNYTFSYVNGTLEIRPAILSITADDLSKQYGQPNPTLTMSVSGFVNGDDLGDIVLPNASTTASTISGAGTYPVILQGGSASNYLLTLANGTLTIEKAPLLITADDKTSIYGEQMPELTFTVSGFANGDNVDSIVSPQIITSATTGSPSGLYPITLTGGSATNYSIQLVNGTLTVEKALLSLVADNQSRTYGSPNPALTVSAIGLVNGDSLKDVTGLQITTNAVISSPVGNYTIDVAVGNVDNYNVTMQPGVLTIDPSPLNIKATDLSRNYGDVNPVLTMTISGFVNGDDIDDIVAPAISTSASVSSLPDTYPIELSGGSAMNYSLTLVNGSLSVGQVPLTITADLKVINKGQPLPVFTSTISGLLNADVISGITYSATAVNTSIAGEYNNMPSVNMGAYPQYNISFVPSKLYVNPAGAGARKIIVKRECVTKLEPAINGYGYAAVFSYENPNTTPFFVAKGVSNKITIDAGGSVTDNLPEVFMPGSHQVTVLFTGHQMRWSVTTIGSTHTTANTAANNAGNCTGAVVSKGQPATKASGEINVYPNPATRSLFIEATGGELKLGRVLVSDALGRIQVLKIVRAYSSQMEIDISMFKAGTYFIRMEATDGEIKTVKFIKH